MRIAVVGAGVAGIGSAWLLSREHEVDLFEARDRLGGHAHTSDVTVGGRTFPIDTGFMVFNDRTYPHVTRFFEHLGVAVHDADMSFSVQCAFDLIEWAGNLGGVFAQPRNLLRRRFWSMLADALRMSRDAERLLADTPDSMSLGDLLEREGFGAPFMQWYFVPMASAIWSARPMEMLEFPATTFLRFMDNHGLLHVTGKPAWKSVRGGSRTYVEAACPAVNGEIRTGTPVVGIDRGADGVEVRTGDGSHRYDACVLALHAPDALGLLEEPTPQETDILGAFRYSRNPTVVHTDQRFLPTNRRAHAAWNYFAETGRVDADRLSVTYYLNRLQDLPSEDPVLVTLNPFVVADAGQVLFSLEYEHPLFDRTAIDAQHRVPHIQGTKNTWYAGAWQRYGFHEDGLWSAVRAAGEIGVVAPWADELAAERVIA
jgi:predicted NAD/FAD-binding protein